MGRPSSFSTQTWDGGGHGYGRGMATEPEAGSTRRRRNGGGRPRLTTPLVRDGGVLRVATWDEALARAAEGLGRARADIVSGTSPNAFGMFSCSKATNEVNYFAQKFARVVLGSNNIDSCNRT